MIELPAVVPTSLDPGPPPKVVTVTCPITEVAEHTASVDTMAVIQRPQPFGCQPPDNFCKLVKIFMISTN